MGLCLFSSLCSLGPAYDLSFCEVRDNSLVVEWQKPVYAGSGPITGYHVEYAKKGTSEWTTANKTAVSHRFLKVRASLIWFMVLMLIYLRVTGMIIYLKFLHIILSEYNAI